MKDELKAYYGMLRAKLLDEKALSLYVQSKSFFHISCRGHEAPGAAAALVSNEGDVFYPYYRDLALMTTLGMSSYELILSFTNKDADPNSHGRQMPMHYASKKYNVISQGSATGSQYLHAVGSAMASESGVVFVFSGEGACAQGDFHEALNWASRDKLPVVFVIENNRYAISVHVTEQLAGGSVWKLSAGYENLSRYECDGSNLPQTLTTFRTAYNHVKAHGGPALIEAHVVRLGSHSISDDHLKYRKYEEVELESFRCPILNLQNHLKLDVAAITAELQEEINKAAKEALAASDPDPQEAILYSYAEDLRLPETTAKMSSLQYHGQGLVPKEEPVTGEFEYTMIDAINLALKEEMSRNPQMVIYGEDVAKGKGGVFGATRGLSDLYGDRVFNSQLAESSIIGTALGQVIMGKKPVVEIQFGDYIWTAMMQIRNELCMFSYRSKGDYPAPIVIRVPVGGYIRGSHYHSQNIEATFSHLPGVYVVMPSNAYDAWGMLKTAIRMQDPVLFLEHKHLYRQPVAKRFFDGNAPLIDFRAKVVEEGTDLTIVSYGAVLHKCHYLVRNSPHSIELIDLRSMVPLDLDTILSSVKKTSRCLVVHEDTRFMGFGAEIAATINENLFAYLDAPVIRVGGAASAAVPHAEGLEDAILPQIDDIDMAIRKILAW